MLGRLRHISEIVSKALMVVAALWAFVLAFYILIDVIARNLEVPIEGTSEIVTNSIVVVVFLQLAYCVHIRGMLRADFLLHFMGPGGTRGGAAAAALAKIGIHFNEFFQRSNRVRGAGLQATGAAGEPAVAVSANLRLIAEISGLLEFSNETRDLFESLLQRLRVAPRGEVSRGGKLRADKRLLAQVQHDVEGLVGGEQRWRQRRFLALDDGVDTERAQVTANPRDLGADYPHLSLRLGRAPAGNLAGGDYGGAIQSIGETFRRRHRIGRVPYDGHPARGFIGHHRNRLGRLISGMGQCCAPRLPVGGCLREGQMGRRFAARDFTFGDAH